MTETVNVAARPAATVQIVRDGPAGIEVLMITRNVASEFASGALVFPGGRVDAADIAAVTHHHTHELSGADTAALALRVAGIRETYEEAHILLARRPGANALLSAVEVGELEADLEGRLGRPAGFNDLTDSGKIELATDLLIPFAHWITPVGRPKRYDTHFFLIAAPADQVAAHDGHEAVDTLWIGPQDAIDGGDAGRFTVVFATRMNLIKLARSTTVVAAIARAQGEPVVTVLPVVTAGPNGRILRIPAQAGYGITEVSAEGIVPA